MTVNAVSAITLNRLTKIYVVVADVSLEIAEGSFVTLLDPSGSGKSTAPQMIVGFDCADDDPLYRSPESARRVNRYLNQAARRS